MVDMKPWRLEAVSDGTTLRCRSGPDDPRPIELSWTGPPGAAHADFEPVTGWQTREYCVTCECIVRIYAADGTLLGETTHTLSD